MFSAEPFLPVPQSSVQLPVIPRIFAPSSFWYQTIPAGASLNPSSSGMNTNFQAQMAKFFGDVNVAPVQPFYIAPGGTPYLPVVNSGNVPLSTILNQVPILPYMQPAVGGDMEMGIYDPSTDTYYDFWVFGGNATSGYTTNFGGVIGPGPGGAGSAGGIRCGLSNGTFPQDYGAAATSLPYVNGVVTSAELLAGQINHVMTMALVETVQPPISWPASRSDAIGTTVGGVGIPEAARLRIDPTVDVTTLGLPPIAVIIAKAAQTYGWLITDKSGGITMFIEDGTQFSNQGLPDPWPFLLGPIFNNGTDYNGFEYLIWQNMDWNLLQFMPTNYGQPPSQRVQGAIGADGSASASSSASVTLSATVAVGDCVLGAVGCVGPSSPTFAITDDKGNTYSVPVQVTANVFVPGLGGNVNLTVALYRLDGITNGPSTITAALTSGTATNWRVIADEFLFVNGALDGTASNSGAPLGQVLNAVTAGSVTPGSPNDLIYSACFIGKTGDDLVNGQNFIFLEGAGASDNAQLATECQIQPGGGPIVGNWWLQGTSGFVAAMMALKV